MELDLGLLDWTDRLTLRDVVPGKRQVFDTIRQKWLVLQPEELVRQLLVHYLIEAKQYNKNRIALERGLLVNKQQRRCDILVYDKQMAPYLLIECKAPYVKINEAAFRQIALYNLHFQVPYLLVSNGQQSYCCSLDYTAHSFTFLTEVPVFGGEE